MKLNHLTNQDLHSQTKSISAKERLSTIEVLWHLRENEKRMLYAQMGYRDLKEYCVKELKYSEGSAWRRISAMRLLQEIPELENKIESGELNLTQISMVKAHFREVKSNLEQKQEILLSIENQNSKSTERILAELKPESYTVKPKESEKPIKGQNLELTLILDQETQKSIEEIQILLGRPYSKLELFKMMTKHTLENLRKKNKCRVDKKDSKNFNQNATPTDERKAQPLRSKSALNKFNEPLNSRYIPKNILKEVKHRDQHRCRYIEAATKKQCQAQHYLQFEHIKPFALGGGNEASNLQLLCPTHNRLRAIQVFGAQKMESYLPYLIE